MQRADILIVAKGLATTRSQAQHLIKSGRIKTAQGQLINKSGKRYAQDIDIKLTGEATYVSRGGEKLAGFLAQHPIPIHGKQALDIGISTGGFTDCLLRHGALHITGVDVGHGQLHPSLLADPRVRHHEGINARDLSQAPLEAKSYDIIVMDLSFISLKKVLPEAWPFLEKGGHLIALIKPQFEVGPELSRQKRGIIRDNKQQQAVCQNIQAFVERELPHAKVIAMALSHIKGSDGNQEYLIAIARN